MTDAPRRPVRGRLKQAGGVELRTVDAEHFLLSAKFRTIHHLNDMGLAVWRFFATPRTRRQLLTVLKHAFPDIPVERLRADMKALCDELAEEGLLRRMR